MKLSGVAATAVTAAIGLYGLACVAAMVLMVVGTMGLGGVEPDGLAAVWAIVLALPWSLAGLALLPDPTPPLAGAAVVVAGMAINLGLLVLGRRWLKRLAAGGS